VSYIGGMVKRSQQIEDEILARLREGETLLSICSRPGMPTRFRVYEWERSDPEFAAQFAQARQMGFDAIAEETIVIIDERPEVVSSLTGDRIDSGFVSWQKNRVDHRLKLLARWDPKRYGDKQDVTLANKDGETFKTEVDGGALAVELAKAMRALKGGEDERESTS
jgi:hypothetical protein